MPVPLAQNSTITVTNVLSNSFWDIPAFAFGTNLWIILSIRIPMAFILSPRRIASPMIVPMITEKTTAGIFCIRTIVLMPIAMEQHPKIILSLSLKSSDNFPPIQAPAMPPATMEIEFTIIPTGIFVPPANNFLISLSPILV